MRHRGARRFAARRRTVGRQMTRRSAAGRRAARFYDTTAPAHGAAGCWAVAERRGSRCHAGRRVAAHGGAVRRRAARGSASGRWAART